MVADEGSTCWLSDRHEGVADAVAMIEAAGGTVGKVLSLRGKSHGVPNCLHPDIIEQWQAKGWSYRPGFCTCKCEREGEADQCAFLRSIKELEYADNIAVTKAFARRQGFFSAHGNTHRNTILIDEDAIGLMRPPVIVSRHDLGELIASLDTVNAIIQKKHDPASVTAGLAQSKHVGTIASWLWEHVARQQPGAPVEAVDVPAWLRRSKPVLAQTKWAQKRGRNLLYAAFYKLMRRDPVRTVRNVVRDLFDLINRAAGKVVFVDCERAVFHVHIKVTRKKRIIILDATANPDLLQPIFPNREVRVLFNEPVQPAGRIIQFMDFNGPRSYLNKHPKKLVRIIDAIGELHPEGTVVLISHKSCVMDLAKASRHKSRIKVAHFGALRGRNDLEPSATNRIACHIVCGSPKTTEQDRQQLALAIYGRSILPFSDLQDVRRAVIGQVPVELDEGDGQAPRRRIWEVKIKGYADPQMQAIYNHTVTAELTQAADRARVLIHQDAVVYLVTNEPCPQLWFAEMCYAWDLLESRPVARADFEQNSTAFEEKALELLNAGQTIGNADVCRALDRKPGWGKRYWTAFNSKYSDSLEGTRKVRWKAE